MSKRYKAGVIGRTGAGDYGHGLETVYRDLEQVDLVAVADPDPEGRPQPVSARVPSGSTPISARCSPTRTWI